jgi:hypothetical protein
LRFSGGKVMVIFSTFKENIGFEEKANIIEGKISDATVFTIT